MFKFSVYDVVYDFSLYLECLRTETLLKARVLGLRNARTDGLVRQQILIGTKFLRFSTKEM